MTDRDVAQLLAWIDEGLAPGEGPDPAALVVAFNDLPPVRESELIGEWTGGAFGSNHPTERDMAEIRWAGKSIRSRDDVDPIVCLDARGNRVANDLMGTAMIREVVWEGVVSAAMIYDRQPIIDHFRRLNHRTLMGLMTRKGWDAPLPFWLRRL